MPPHMLTFCICHPLDLVVSLFVSQCHKVHSYSHLFLLLYALRLFHHASPCSIQFTYRKKSKIFIFARVSKPSLPWVHFFFSTGTSNDYSCHEYSFIFNLLSLTRLISLSFCHYSYYLVGNSCPPYFLISLLKSVTISALCFFLMRGDGEK